MKILHVGNYADISTTLKKIDRSRGDKSDILKVVDSKLFHYNHKIIVSHNPITIIKYLLYGLQYDKIYIHWHKLQGLDTLFFKLFSKRVVTYYHGSDIRNKGTPRFDIYADECYVSTPDLLKYCNEDTLWLRSPIDIEQYKYMGLENKPKLNIIHAAASHKHGLDCKGTDVIFDAVKIAKNKGYDFNFNTYFGISHDELMDRIRQADIVIAQTNIGWYGLLELEAMAMGKPVITWIDYDIIEAANVPDIPVMDDFFRNDSITLAGCICELIDNKRLRNELSKRGRKYVEQWHSTM
jgi:glycosyltransferase involved in cell wall biosynthesis